MAQDTKPDDRAENENVDGAFKVSDRETSAHGPEDRTTEEVRQGHTGDHVRYILAISFIGALAALIGLYLAQRPGPRDETAEPEAIEPAQIRVDEMQSGNEAPAADAGARARAAAELSRPGGEPAGAISLAQTPNGVLLTATLRDLPPGEHGFHIHKTGACTPDFEAAGGHFAPRGRDHGFDIGHGPHAGDMPNIHVGGDGRLKTEIVNPRVSLVRGEDGYLLDDDGSAIIIHGGADDYRSQPSGAAGDRIACGVVKSGPG